MNPRRQGDLGEASALGWLVQAGAEVFVPFGSATDYDLVADFGDGPLRVQVKTSRRPNPRGGWVVQVATYGGNRSWNGVVKEFCSTRCDLLFVLIADGRRWAIPAEAVAGRRAIVVGGAKYAAYEVEPGRPFPATLATLRDRPAG